MACAAAIALQAGTTSVALGDAPRSAHSPRWGWGGQFAFSCDPARFEGEPHYAKVRITDGAIASIHLHRTEDGAEVVTSHPYGTARAIGTDDTRELCVKLDRLKHFVDRLERRQRILAWLERGRRFQPRLAAARQAEAPGAEAPAYNTGLLIGWNPSIGPTTGECYNFTTEPPASNVGSLSFTSENAAQNTTDQTRVSATVGGAYGAFSASASFAYTDKWQASANTGSAYFNISSVWRLNSTVDSTNPLTAQGQGAVDDDQFATLCGTEYMTSVLGGMVATVAVNYGSSSATASSDIDTKFKASFGLDSLTGAVDVSKDASDSSSFFNVRLFNEGGGAKAGALLASEFGATNSAGDAYVEECANGDVDACELFVSNMGQGAIDATAVFNNLAQDVEPGQDISFFSLFPNGIAGVDGDLATAVARSASDILAPYQDQLEQYLTLVNQIATLGHRAAYLNTLLGDDFNPNAVDLSGYLGRMADSTEGTVSYATSRTILLDDLGTCLNATSTNVVQACSPIINGGETLASAYDFYDREHGYPECTNGENEEDCWFLQQNAIALQYAATFTVDTAGTWPEDVIYIDELPDFSGPPADIIARDAALVAFVDRPFYYFGIERETTNVSMLALETGTDLSEIYTSVPSETSAFEWFGIWLDNEWYEQSGNRYGRRTNWTTETCSPTFAEPCPIGFEWSYPPSGQVDIRQTTNQIVDIFAAD